MTPSLLAAAAIVILAGSEGGMGVAASRHYSGGHRAPQPGAQGQKSRHVGSIPTQADKFSALECDGDAFDARVGKPATAPKSPLTVTPDD
jgi:hypothetical protein